MNISCSKRRVIVIPIYKDSIDEYEKVSLLQCCKIFKHEELSILTYLGLNINAYINILESEKVCFTIKLLDERFFKGVEGYNTMVLNRCFYEAYKSYDWMLIYQTDAFVFNNELDYYCNKKWVYIGAPTFKNSNYSHPQHVLNGGLSLRYIPFFLQTLESKRFYWRFCNLYLFKRIGGMKLKTIFKVPYLLYQAYCLKNGITKIFPTKGLWALTYEDYVWCALAEGKLPTWQEASRFSFENSCHELYELNNGDLPMGCHAWYKFGNYEFWKNFIKFER